MEAFGPWSAPTLGIAVSGGPDSLALLLLAHQWAQAHHGKVIALHVDHRLRSTSQEEAKNLQQFCQQYKIPCHVLVWEHGPIKSKIQQSARNARYQLLLKQCEALGILYLLTAHHQNDQLETVQMRAMRKSGPRGLAGIQAITWTPIVKILRPLLDFSKEALLEYVKDLPYLQDPSNLNDKFTRVRIRKDLETLPLEMLQRHIREYKKLQTWRTQEEAQIWHYLATNAILHPWGFAELRNTQQSLPPLMAIAFLLQYVSGKSYLPDQHSLKKLSSSMPYNSSKAFTVHTCTVWNKDEKWYFAREQRRPLRTKIKSPESFYWDHRFLVDLIPQKPLYLGLELGMLGKKGRQQLCQRDIENIFIPWRILESLPAFWVKDSVVSIPHLGINLSPNVCKDTFPRLRFVPHYDILRFEPTEQE